MIRNFELIGEASRNLLHHFPAFVAEHPQLPLAAAYGMRNVLAHGYAEVDIGVVWVAIERDIPELRKQLEALMR